MGCSSCGKRRRKYAPPQPAAVEPKSITETIPVILPNTGITQQPEDSVAPENQVNATSTPTPALKKQRNYRQIRILNKKGDI